MFDKLLKIYVEPTSKCNLNCSMCFRNTWIDEDFEDMTMGTFKNIIRTIPENMESIFFGGMGEPLSHKDIVIMVEEASKKASKVELLTNATLLDARVSSDLLDAGLDSLWISVDSFEEEGYGSIRKNGKLSLVKENIKKFNEERRRRLRKIKLGLTFVAMKNNVKQIEKIPFFAAINGVDEVNISNVIPSDANSASQTLYNRVVDLELGAVNAEPFSTRINIPMMDWRQKDVMESLQSILSNSMCEVSLSGIPLTRKTRYCRFIEEGNLFVRYDGNISPCMGLLHSGSTFWGNEKRTVLHHSFGNVNVHGLLEIWKSKEYSEFRERVRRFDFSPCIHCGGCQEREGNRSDCFGNMKPTCGACLWSEGIISCP